MLTRKQYDLLLFIHQYLAKHGVSPSFEEMKEGLGLKSKSGIHRLISGLVERGFLTRLNNRARALEVVRLPENIDPETLPQRNRRSDSIRHHDIVGVQASPQKTSARDNIIQLPLYGRIAAGTPIEALRDESIMVEVPVTMLGKGDHYALEVEGDSMVEAGILDGDTVVIERIDQAESGEIIVALIDEHEATLKRYEYKNDMITLFPANRHYQINHYRPDRINVQGRLVGLLRKY
ncbi:MAG: transcriptional repressor LexA [Alphaproteobacteria bacterium]